jgi:putative peptidoglycan lipid II flippase
VLLVVLVGRTWGWGALSLPPRPLVATLTGSVAAAGAGRAVASWLSAGGVGHSLGSSLLVGVGVGVLALAVMIGLALAVDPSLAARVRRARGVPTAAQETVP